MSSDLFSELAAIFMYYTGAEVDEIDEFEAELGHPLPAVYRIFLANVGGSNFMVGSDISLYSVRSLNRTRLELWEEIEMTSNTCICFGHQDYIIDFFRIDGTDDPEVFTWSESAGFIDWGIPFTVFAVTHYVLRTPEVRENAARLIGRDRVDALFKPKKRHQVAADVVWKHEVETGTPFSIEMLKSGDYDVVGQ